jgi:NAD(P)H-hydrate epimerase
MPLRPPATYVFDRAAVREVDRLAIEQYGIPGALLMENAARGLAEQARRMLADAPRTPPVVWIVCGSGNNGGDGFALARHLRNLRAAPLLTLPGEPKPDSDAALHLAICRRMGIHEITSRDIGPDTVDLVVDALFGTGLDRPIEGAAAALIRTINARHVPVLAADIPSGLDCDTGRPLGDAVIRASRTVTFVGMKAGFLAAGAKEYTGEVVVADVGAPIELLERLGRPMRT